MANTFYTIYLHTVFAVKYREALIPVGLQDEFFRVVGGIINEKGGESSIKIHAAYLRLWKASASRSSSPTTSYTQPGRVGKPTAPGLRYLRGVGKPTTLSVYIP